MTNSNLSHLTKGEYLSQLAQKLKVLPENERRDALEYYDGYLSDAENEQAAIAQLGSPGEVAATILATHVENRLSNDAREHGTAFKSDFKAKKSGLKAAWIAILAIFALPVGLPLLIVVAVVPLVLFVALGSVVFALGVSGVMLFVGGAISLLVTPFVFVQDFGFGLITGGMGILLIGLGLLLVKLVLLMMGGFRAIARFASRKILRRSKNGRFQAV